MITITITPQDRGYTITINSEGAESTFWVPEINEAATDEIGFLVRTHLRLQEG